MGKQTPLSWQKVKKVNLSFNHYGDFPAFVGVCHTAHPSIIIFSTPTVNQQQEPVQSRLHNDTDGDCDHT